MNYLGNFAEDASVYFCWNTNDRDGASITRATDGTIKVRRDDGTDCTGGSITDTEDTPDTGIHECTVDTSDNVNYAIAHDYVVWLDGAVIDGQTVNVRLATFSIENRLAKLAADGLDNIPTTQPNGVASTFREMLVQTWRRFFKKAVVTPTQLKTHKDNDDVNTTQTIAKVGTTKTVGDAS